MRVQLQVEPATHTFTCRYRLTLPAADTSSVIRLNLNGAYNLQRVKSPHATQQQAGRTVYLGDTLHQILVRYASRPGRARHIELSYTGRISQDDFTDRVSLLSGHSNWLPFRPLEEYELVTYELAVQVPTAYQVRSTVPARRQAGRWEFRGTTSAIELTAFIATEFRQAISATQPAITMVKPVASLTHADTLLLQQAENIVAFYDCTIGRQDPIRQFTIFLPGTNHGAYGLLTDATVISYTDFDMAKRGDLLILAHEISHKWWAYGSFHTADGWLSEAFATYSSLLYLQASGDKAGYQAELARLAQSAADTPPLWGFNRASYEPAMYRRVIYNKGTVVLSALRARLGDEQFMQIMAVTATQKTSTTADFLNTVAQVAGPANRDWLLAELKR